MSLYSKIKDGLPEICLSAGLVTGPFTPFILDRIAGGNSDPRTLAGTGVIIAAVEIAAWASLRRGYTKQRELTNRLDAVSGDLKTANRIRNTQELSLDELLSAALERERLIGLERDELVKILGFAVDAQTPYSSVKGVLQLGRAFLEYLTKINRYSFSDEELVDFDNILRLHDVGKLRVKKSILDLTRELKDEEYDAVKAHAIRGGEFLRKLQSLKHIAYIVQAHHENWDGTGYPNRLNRENIPFFARIVRIIDSYQAMRSHRPYNGNNHTPKTNSEAIADLESHRGKRYDPDLLSYFVDFIKKYEPALRDRNPELFYYGEGEASQAATDHSIATAQEESGAK